MKQTLWKYFILFIVAFAFLLRVYRIDSIPPSLSWDEVSIGYNAYSLLKTGRDEHGKIFPLDAFAGYGDYKPPVAIYLTIPSVAVFGLNEFAIRFPAAFFGTLTVLLTYFLVSELFNSRVFLFRQGFHLRRDFGGQVGGQTNFKFQIALLSSLLLAVSPWHINISRAGFEATIALFFVVLGVFALLRTREQKKLWYIAWIPFVIAIYTFNSSRYFIPFFSIGLLFFIWPSWKKTRKEFMFGSIIAGIILLPLIPHLLSKEARLRFTEVNIFTDAAVVQKANLRLERDKGSFISKILDNRRVTYGREYLVHFFDHFEPSFLFIKGDGNPKFSIQDVGQLYIIEAPFLVIGIFSLFIVCPEIAVFLLFWLLVSIVPAATARETPHALRILNSLPTWHIFIAFGIVVFIARVNSGKKSIYYFICCFALFIFYLCNFAYYLHNYYRHYPVEFSGEWQYGYRDALIEVKKIESNYSSIIISDTIGRPYMYTLFYMATDPNEYLKMKDSVFDNQGFYHVYGFGKYHFGGAVRSPLAANTLYVWDAGSVPKDARVIKTIRLLNGSPVLVVFDNGEVTL